MIQNTMIIGCFYGMSFDKTVWPDTDPEMDCFKFRPERFLKDGKIVVPERHYPFGNVIKFIYLEISILNYKP